MRMNNITGMPKTVNERLKMNGGILAGPNHKFSNQRIRQTMEEGGEPDMGDEEEAEGPPNLRDAERMDSCATCTHYGAQKCQKYDTDVDPGDVCDAFTKAGEAGPEDLDAVPEGVDEDDD